MKTKLLLGLFILSLSGCSNNPNKESVQMEEDTTNHRITECSPTILDIDSAIQFVNADSYLDFNKENMNANLTKGGENIVRAREESYNQRLLHAEEEITKTETLVEFEEYVSIVFDVFNKALKQYGYKTPDNSSFQKRVNDLWLIDQETVLKFHDFFSFDNAFSDTFARNSSVVNSYLELDARHISTKYNLVLFTPRLITYFFTFKKTIKVEDGYGDEIDVYDVNSEITINSKFLLHDVFANLFVFNGSKAAKTWLMTNDLDFFNRIEYWEDREVNEKKLKKYLNSVPDEYDNFEIEDVFKVNDCWGRFGDREVGFMQLADIWCGDDMMNLVQEKTDSAIVAYEEDKSRKLDIKAFDLLAKYLFKYKDVKYNGSSCNTNPYFVKKACIFAMMEVTLNKKHSHENKNGYFNIESTSLSYRLFNDELLDVAKKENYFNIKSFDEVLKVIEWDKEHDPQGSNDYSPFDYTTLVTQNP